MLFATKNGIFLVFITICKPFQLKSCATSQIIEEVMTFANLIGFFLNLERKKLRYHKINNGYTYKKESIQGHGNNSSWAEAVLQIC